MTNDTSTIAVLGASGLIGAALAEGLQAQDLRVIAVARRFTAAQIARFGEGAVTYPIVDCSAKDLHDLLRTRGVDVVVNCVGVLQDGSRGTVANVHKVFVARLLDAIRAQPKPMLLVHLSMPGEKADDVTAFSRSKREGEGLIAAGNVPFVVLRPGFVVAPAAYGGSALVRALAASPLALPAEFGARPFAATSVDDITRTVSVVARRWAAGERQWDAMWDLCERRSTTVAAVIEALRARFGGPVPRATLPVWLLWIGAWAGDAAARLGWSPPVRTTALREMLRGVEGRPDAWIEATGIEPASLNEALRRVPTTVQERWFARLFLLKPVIFVTLAVFWAVSGSIALTVAFAPARPS